MNGEYQGQVLGLTGYLLYGWAWQPQSPDERVVVEAYIGGLSLGVTIANVFEEDLKNRGIGDGSHGFVFGLPQSVLEDGGQLQVRIANSGQWLAPEIELAEPPLNDRLDSQVFCDGGLRLTGWAQQLANPETPLTVVVASEEGEQWQYVADKYNPHAANQHKWCGFDITLPMALADGRAHEINLTAGGKDLKGSPVTIACFPEGDAGYFERELAHALPPEQSQLFAELLQENRHYTPRSVGFEHYAQWFALFGAPRQSLNAGNIRIGVQKVAKQSAGVSDQSHQHDYIALVAEGDRLADWALEAVADAIHNSEVAPGMVYTDSDQDDSEGGRSQPHFKSSWDLDLFCQQNYLAPLCVIAADIVEQLPPDNPTAWTYLAVQRCIEMGRPINHLPEICYHRAHAGFDWNDETAQRQLQTTVGWRKPLSTAPTVSVIIPTRDQLSYLQACIESVQASSYQELEIIVVNNQSMKTETLHYLAGIRSEGITVIDYDQPFNYAAINNVAVDAANGDVICLLNNDVEVLSADWLESLLAELQRDEVGAVGAKLLWPNGMVQHGGVILGLNKVAGHYGNQWLDSDPGYQGLNHHQRQVAAVTGACLLVSKADFLAVGGLNAIDFPVAFNDVDLCLKVQRQLGKQVVYCPQALLQHDESVSRGKEDRPEKQARALREIRALRQHWGDELLRDRAYNPNLNLDALAGPYQGLALPPRPRQLR